MGQDGNPDVEELKLRFDYAWKWFSFHADQRTKIFNFMLLALSIFLAGVVNGLGKKSGVPHQDIAYLCFVAGGFALIFRLLDRRNRDLVWLGEDLLMYLERERIFKTNGKFTDRNDNERHFGILWRQVLEERNSNKKISEKLAGKSCVPVVIFLRDAWLAKHRVWFPIISYLIAALFFAVGIVILKWPSMILI